MSLQYELPAPPFIDVTPPAKTFEPFDASRITTFRHIKLAAPLVEEFRRNPANFIKGFEEIVPESSEIRETVKDHFFAQVPSTLVEGESRKITADILQPGGISRGIRRAKNLIRPQPDLPFIVQIEPIDIRLPNRQLPLFE